MKAYILLLPYFTIIMVFSFTIVSCTEDNLEDIAISDYECIENDSLEITYKDVQPIFEHNCYECHTQTYFNGNVKTDSYDELKKAIESGKLWGAISRNGEFTPMPYQRSQLPACELSKIKKWIDNGMPL